MKAEIIAVGSELLTPLRSDTNSLFLTEVLNERGVDVRAKMIVGDDRDELAQLFAQSLARADLIILTGGLGPTDDDITREAVAQVLGRELEESAAIVDAIRARFASRGLRMPEINRRQAMVPRGAHVLDNPNGTAPGLWMEDGARLVLLLPGPPAELQPIFIRWGEDVLAPRRGAAGLFRRVLSIVGRPESDVDELAQPIYSRWREQELPITTTILAAFGQIELHLCAQALNAEQASEALEPAIAELAAALGSDVFSTKGEKLEEIVGALLRDRGMTVALAESCTGGLVASRLTDVAGSSAYVLFGVVCYTNESKTDLLGVPSELIERHGAVSEPVAIAMAEAARERGKATFGIGVTGIAGPSGGTAEKPVGTVFAAVGRQHAAAAARKYRFIGQRKQIKFQASQAALDQLRRALLEIT